MENFTKEEIDSAKRIWDSWGNCTEWGGMVGFPQYLETLSKPKRKEMFIKVEFDDIKPEITIEYFRSLIIEYIAMKYNLKVFEVDEEGDYYDD